MTADALELERNKVATFFTPATVDPPPHPLSGLTAFVAMRRNLLEMVDAELSAKMKEQRVSMADAVAAKSKKVEKSTR